ncbi:ABC transporter transmembrane domain-containing protein [Vibrio bathopelagicus]|uniref:ABC transporter transmembrane domain-containing protein n=1 Tax=Vibrio bathopelagicus TaxID=2777577 RepID=UPI001863FE79|nr:ABC transporter ATP-binding protein [Vibrio bathopelagicus]
MNKLNYLPKLSITDSCFLVASSTMTTLLGLVLPFSILIIFDRIIPNNSSSSLYFIFVIILVAIALDYRIKNIEESMVSRIGNRFENTVTNQLFHAICHSKGSQFKRLETGEYLERLTTIMGLKSFYSGELISAFINAFTCLITLIVIAIINPPAGAILALASAFLLAASLHLSRKKIALMKMKSDSEGATNSNIINIISFPLDIKSRSMEFRLENLMDAMVKEREYHTSEFEKQESKFNLTLTLIQQLAIVLTVVTSAIAVINLDISQGVMAAIILLTNRFFAPYQQTMRAISQWEVNKNYIARLNEILELESEQDAHAVDEPPPKTLNYSGRSDYQFLSNKISVLSGQSGSGKSSILRAFTHTQHDNEYQVSTDQLSAEQYLASNTENNVILIDKSSTFVDGTIIDNITCFRPQLHKAAYSLCESLGIKSDIDDLKLGFYTDITTTGVKPFSRKVSFALLIVRALLSNKKILLIDYLDLSYDEAFCSNLLSCLRPRVNSYLFIIASNKIKHVDMNLQYVNANEVA